MPFGHTIPYSRPPPASGLSGLSRWSWPWSRRCRRRRSSLPCVRSSAASAAPFLSPVAHARRRRNPAAGRWTLPAASHPRLRFGHPARPPKGHHRFSFLYTSIVSGVLFVVSLCLAAVGCAVTARWRYGCALNSCQDCASGSSWNSCHDWLPECGRRTTQNNKDSKTRDFVTKKRTPLEELEFRTHHYFDLYFFTISIPPGSSTLARLNCNGAGTSELSPHEKPETPPLFQSCDKSPELRERIKKEK